MKVVLNNIFCIVTQKRMHTCVLLESQPDFKLFENKIRRFFIQIRDREKIRIKKYKKNYVSEFKRCLD